MWWETTCCRVNAVQSPVEEISHIVGDAGSLRRLTRPRLVDAQVEWEEVFHQRSQAGVCGGDALLWRYEFMSSAGAACEAKMSGYVLLDRETNQ